MRDDIFVIGDIHGCANELIHLLTKLPITRDSLVVFLGDYIDRGPAASKVVDTIIDLFNYCQVVPLMGNHEQLLLNFLKEGANDEDVMNFIYNGGNSTLSSYADANGEYRIPGSHQKFFTSLKLFHTTDKYFFVHAGTPDIPLDNISEKDRQELLWIRSNFFESTFPWNKLIIHGHTPVKEIDITDRRINLDTGCVYGNKLSAMGLPSLTTYHIVRDSSKDQLMQRPTGRQAIRHEGSFDILINTDGKEVLFKSIDFNELGMLVYFNQESDIAIGTIITGKIKQKVGDIAFRGEVIRKDSHGNFAIKFSEPIISQY